MRTKRSYLVGLIGIALVALVGTLAVPASAAFTEWTGASGTDNYWATGGNWSSGAPGFVGEALFPAIAPAQMTADLNGVSLGTMGN